MMTRFSESVTSHPDLEDEVTEIQTHSRLFSRRAYGLNSYVASCWSYRTDKLGCPCHPAVKWGKN